MDFEKVIKDNDIEKLQELIDAHGLYSDSNYIDIYNLLISALMNDQKSIARMLIENGCQVNKILYLKPESTPLHYAVKLDSIELVELLLRKGAIVEAKNEKGETPLHVAAKHNKHYLTDLLLSSISSANDIECADNNGFTYLHIACSRNNNEIIEYLLQNKANVNSKINLNSTESPGFTPLHIAVACHNIKAVQLLIKYNADINIKAYGDITPLHLAVKEGQLQIVKILLRQDAREINAQLQTELWPGYTAVHLAVLFEHLQILLFLIRYKADINVKNNLDITPLHLAINTHSSKIYETVEILVNNNADVNCISKANMITPLHIAISKNHTTVIDILLQKGANVNLRRKDGVSALHMAAYRISKKQSKRDEIFRQTFMIFNDPISANPQLIVRDKNAEIVDLLLSMKNLTEDYPIDPNGMTHLHIACMRKKLGIAEQFLKKEIDVNKQIDKDSKYWPGYTALHFAVECCDFNAVQLLLDYGADPRITNQNKLSPLHIAASLQIESIIDAMLSSLEKIMSNVSNDNGLTKLHIACMGQCSDTLQVLLESNCTKINEPINVRSPDWPEYTPLLFAVKFRRKSNVQLLLSHDANVNARDIYGMTPLHLACLNGDIKIVKMLLEYNVDINSVVSRESEHYSKTALHIACNSPKPNWLIVNLLLNYGADINIEDSDGNVALCCLYKNLCKNLSIVNLIDVVNTYSILRYQVLKLDKINLYVNEKMKVRHSNLAIYIDEDYFSKICDTELEQLKNVRVNKYASLYDLLFKEPNEMANLVKNTNLINIFKTKEFKENYPFYANMLIVQFQKGQNRKRILPSAKQSLAISVGFEMPDSCSENIIRYLSNKDLNSLIEVGKISR